MAQAPLLLYDRQMNERGWVKVEISINQLESAINFWRQQVPDRGGIVLCEQAAALSKPYALMIYYQQRSIDLQQFEPAARAALEAFLKETTAG